MASLEILLGVKNGLAGLSPETHAPEELYVTRTLVRDSREVPTKILNTTCREQKLMKGSPWHFESQSRC